jgi:hypothetical protein
MEASATTTPITTYTDVITKFKDLKRKYYMDRGCMVSTVDDDFAKEFLRKHQNLVWEETYNAYAEAEVLTAKINVIIFGQPFAVYLHRPIKQIHLWEYEEFFGFGGHCEGFSFDRIIASFEEHFDDNIDIEYLLMTGTLANGEGDGDDDNGKCCTIDEKYIKNTLKLMVLGGYVKYWAAFNEFKEWFKEHGFNVDFETDNTGTMTSFIFEEYEYVAVEKPVQDCKS